MNLYQFILRHHRNHRMRYELLYSSDAPSQAVRQMQAIWPSYAPWLERTAFEVDQKLYSELQTAAETRKHLKTLLIGSPRTQRWGIAYLNPQSQVMMSLARLPLPAQEFSLNDTEAWLASDRYTFRPAAKLPHNAPEFVSFYGASL